MPFFTLQVLQSFHTSYTATIDERASKPDGDRIIKNETRSGTNRDTVSISVEGQQFAAGQKASDSEMGLIGITSDLDSFRSAVKSMNEPLTVDWTAIVDPYQTFTNLAKIESRLKQLADPAVSHNDEDMERVADVYAKSKIDILIAKKKAMLESGTAKKYNEEYAEYKIAYDAYHSENGESMIAMMSGDTKKAYNIPQPSAAIKLKKNHPIRRCTCYNAHIRYLCTNPSGTKFPCKHSYERMIL